jgi:N-acetylneuraminic acid mutarotase
MITRRRLVIGAIAIPGIGALAASSEGAPGAAPVTRSVRKNLPERVLFKTVTLGGKVYAFHYEDNDATPSAKLAAGGGVYAYDPAAGRWHARARMPAPKASYSIVAVNDSVYIIGGLTTPGTPSGSVEEYDPARNVWTVRKSMPTPRCRMGTAVADGRIFAMGGKVAEGVTTAAVEAYDPVHDTWSTRRPLSTPVMGVHAAAIKGKIYKVKGTKLAGKSYEMLMDFEEYDPSRDVWTRRAPWKWEKEPLEVVALDERLFVVGAGAYSGPDARSLKEYRIGSDEWVFRSDMPGISAHTIHPGWTVAGGRIYVFGGGYRSGNSWAASDRAQRYDPAADRWEELPPMSERKMAMGVAAAGNRIFVVGGEIMQGTWEAGRNPLSNAVEIYAIGTEAPTG